MIRTDNKVVLMALIAFAMTSVFTLGACSKKKTETLPDTSVADASTAGDSTAGSGGMNSEDQEQMGARDPGYTDEAQLQDAYFDFDKSELRPDARDVLQQNADWIKANSGAKVQIEGHCDERGTEEYNLALGERRANSVKNYLVSLGISPDRLFTISYGEELPVDPGHEESAWSKNRRAHFLVTQ
ncbi:Tol-Pal system peptidoglycan-associated lipoprotein PAL [hydrothermal vent metagenome]|uniref:Tol-Pal system peptidoglycan-associated lipoprotein PAL n=1 Tax=hydrothermal vent metagenome TaxID=652676 RepID=A0A3B1BQ56_9ZZZZ